MMKFLRRLRGRGRYHFEQGSHWFLLAVIALFAMIVGAVMLY